ncbi:hypothetical protein P171DRAFT_426546 [Karstenula rhodostoma CBS 690.94]|uniref:Uncharacterized protein n=1 Tax=Karstenula rhodostoma CBS 690.94 TaxID=1392251 RepID=A0A9P4UJG5_9PLEO|nr:hypothetical protein P171DRAFT_426546 [Karstenula rhodostoma CBS 690.94]
MTIRGDEGPHEATTTVRCYTAQYLLPRSSCRIYRACTFPTTPTSSPVDASCSSTLLFGRRITCRPSHSIPSPLIALLQVARQLCNGELGCFVACSGNLRYLRGPRMGDTMVDCTRGLLRDCTTVRRTIWQLVKWQVNPGASAAVTSGHSMRAERST